MTHIKLEISKNDYKLIVVDFSRSSDRRPLEVGNESLAELAEIEQKVLAVRWDKNFKVLSKLGDFEGFDVEEFFRKPTRGICVIF